MKTSFKKASSPSTVATTEVVPEVPANAVDMTGRENPAPATEGPSTSSESQVAVPREKSLSQVDDSFYQNNVEGEYDKSDIRIPRLNLVQGVGDLSVNFNKGTFVYNGEHVIAEAGRGDALSEDLFLVVLRMRKDFSEKQTQAQMAEGTPPQIFQKAEEALKAGFKPLIEKRKWPNYAYFEPRLHIEILLRGKPGVHDALFPLADTDGTPYAKALWTVKSLAYGAVATPLITFATQTRTPLQSVLWKVNSKVSKFNDFWVATPSIRQAGKVSESLADLVRACV